MPRAQVPKSLRRRARIVVDAVDDELYYYLLRYTTFRTRNELSLTTLMAKAYKFFDDHDTTLITYEQRWKACVQAVTKAMDVTPEEILARNHFKDPIESDQRQKLHDLTTKGLTGRQGFFKRACPSLPK